MYLTKRSLRVEASNKIIDRLTQKIVANARIYNHVKLLIQYCSKTDVSLSLIFTSTKFCLNSLYT